MKSNYEKAGVKHLGKAKPADSLVGWLRKTFDFRKDALGEVQLDFGQYANVLKISKDLGVVVKTDGVGTKVLIAQMMNKYDTVGIDCVAMNVNDMICLGAEPLSMLDYIAVEEARPELFEQISRGLYEGAKQANITIPGGEVAQVRDLIKGIRPGCAFDLVGFGVGTINLNKIITGKEAKPGDMVLGLESSGLHSNGYTLAREVLFKKGGLELNSKVEGSSKTLGEELLTPTKIYVKEILNLVKKIDVKALFHITGGGWLNLQRITSPVGFELDYVPEVKPIFSLIQSIGKLSDAEMYSAFNMGIGMMIVVAKEDVDTALEILNKHKVKTHRLGVCVKDQTKKVNILPKRLVGISEKFTYMDKKGK